LVLNDRTAGRQISMTMREVLKNQRLIGSTMGSHADLISATMFLAKHRIVPVVAQVIDGLENAEEGFEFMQRGDGFGKIVIKIGERRRKANI
jgi:D-arabinose 1-dehydrogenase-like Zn-dependent alcohol dehydrogenase